MLILNRQQRPTSVPGKDSDASAFRTGKRLTQKEPWSMYLLNWFHLWTTKCLDHLYPTKWRFLSTEKRRNSASHRFLWLRNRCDCNWSFPVFALTFNNDSTNYSHRTVRVMAIWLTWSKTMVWCTALWICSIQINCIRWSPECLNGFGNPTQDHESHRIKIVLPTICLFHLIL